MDLRYPDGMPEFHAQCRERGLTKATVLIMKYGRGGHCTLHQDLAGELFFPLQAVFLLSESGSDFTAGEIAMIELHPPRRDSTYYKSASFRNCFLAFSIPEPLNKLSLS